MRTAAIAGAGIAGLAAAVSLRKHGFDVTIYEASDDPREFGAGIYLKENSLRVLDKLGLTEDLVAKGVRTKAARVIDEYGQIITSRTMDRERLYVVLREDLHSALKNAALESGVRLVTNAKVTGADPRGELHLSDGAIIKADVVIGADGLNSRVRDSLGLGRIKVGMGDGATRLVVPRNGDAPYSTEYWSGHLRVGVAPCSPDLTYMYIIGPEKDRQAARLPLNKEYWSAAFPHLEEHFNLIKDTDGVHHTHGFVHCDSWVKGRVAIIGDAAHAQPPNFGQGAGLAIAAAWELATALASGDDVRDALNDWHYASRPRIDAVQRLTTLYDFIAYKWPRPLAPLKSKLFTMLSNLPGTSRQWEYYWRGGISAPGQIEVVKENTDSLQKN